MHELEVAHWDIASVNRAEVLRYLGHAGQEMTDALSARIDDGIDRCLDVCQPAGTFRIFDIGHAGDGGVTLEGGPELRGHDIAAHLAGSTQVALVACTLGLACEREITRLGIVSPLDQAVFDAAASALVERAADAAEARVMEVAAQRGLFCTDRFAPGYGDLPLDVQDGILRALDASKRLGMNATPSHMLVPSKSETAVIGLADAPQPHRTDRMCGVCGLADFCTIRHTGRTCRG